MRVVLSRMLDGNVVPTYVAASLPTQTLQVASNAFVAEEHAFRVPGA